MARYYNDKKRSPISILITVIIGVIIIFIGFDYIYPVKNNEKEVATFLEKEHSLTNVEVKNKEMIKGKIESGAFYLFTYGPNSDRLGKATFTELFGRMKPVEVHLDSDIKQLNTLTVSGKNHRIVSGGFFKEQRTLIIKDGSINKEYKVIEEFPVWTYPIEPEDVGSVVNMELK